MDELSVAPGAIQLESRTLVQHGGNHSPYHEHARLLIHDEDEWEQRWSQIVGDDTPSPAVDFSRDMVLVVAMGVRSTSGYSITVEGVFENAEGLYVQVLETSPGPNCGVLDAISAPVIAVAIPHRDVPVFWLERADTVSCAE
jgi:hypothetical protein